MLESIPDHIFSPAGKYTVPLYMCSPESAAKQREGGSVSRHMCLLADACVCYPSAAKQREVSRLTDPPSRCLAADSSEHCLLTYTEVLPGRAENVVRGVFEHGEVDFLSM